jgi:hypothetical protein
MSHINDFVTRSAGWERRFSNEVLPFSHVFEDVNAIALEDFGSGLGDVGELPSSEFPA